MIEFANILNFLTITFSVALSSMGVALGSSIASFASLRAIYIQPKSKNEIVKATILGMALTETAAILALVVSILLLLNKNIVPVDNYYWNLSNAGIIFALGISGFLIGLMSAFPVKYATLSIARQPFITNKIINIMMISLSFIQTPIIFGFIISLLINYQSSTSQTILDSLRHIGSGLSIGIGCIGPVIGLAQFSKASLESIGYNPESYNKIITFTFISQALIETPIVFALVTSLLLLTNSAVTFLGALAMISAALCTGLSNISPGINSGKTASTACTEIAQNIKQYSAISKTSMLAQGLIDSFAIYGWLVSLLLIFFVK